MSSKTVDSRVQLKHDTQTNWDKATSFIPLASELIIYDPDSNCSFYRIKIGDGTTPVTSLPFLLTDKVDKIEGKALSSNDYTNEDKATVAESASRIIGFASTAGTSAAYTAEIDGATLTPGTMIALRFNVANAANATLDVNSLGAKPIYHKGAAITASKLPINAITLLIYDTAQISTGAWHAIYSHDTNTTYNNAILGQGYGTCTTAEATTEKAVPLSGYSLLKGGITSIKFTYAVPANATLNINNKGAKAIYNRGVAITAGVIQAEDTATFIYDGTQYQLIAIDRQGGDTEGLATEEYVNNALEGKAESDHVHNYAGSDSAGGVANSAKKVANALVIQGNGTILGGYDGSAYKTINITPSSIGAEPSQNLTANRALVSNGSGKVAVSDVTSTELGYLDGVTSAIQTQLNSKQPTITGGATTIASSNLTASRALVSDASGKVGVSDVTSTELGYLDGVTSAIQTQLDAKADKALSGITAGSNITVTPNSNGNGVTIAASSSTPTNAAQGQGYGTCSTAAATAAKVVTLSNYVLSTGGIVSVLFTNAVPANATLNINSKGAKSIYYQNAAIVADVITAGTTATFIYDGTKYHVIAMDKGGGGGANITYGTEDLVAGESPLAEGTIYLVYE